MECYYIFIYKKLRIIFIICLFRYFINRIYISNFFFL
nr:MAG TPA: hypothetical protein [Crassvirales sp.]